MVPRQHSALEGWGSIRDMSEKKPPPNPRQTRLAEALKRNIQRRKATKQPAKPKG